MPSPAPTTSGTQTIRALIDVGTNSVKLLVAEVAGRVVRPLHEESEQTRLGRGFYETHVLQPEAMLETARAVARFAATAADWRATSVRVIATSAARDAKNQAEIIRMVQDVARLPLEVISGEQEAEWVYQGVISDPVLAGQRLLILDVGGGSTEFILGEGDQKQFRESFPIGSVRILEQLAPSDPPTPAEFQRCTEEVAAFIRERVLPDVGPALRASSQPCQLIGTGGASTITGRIVTGMEQFDRDRLEGMSISLAQLRGMTERLWKLPLVERKRIIGLPKKRADVILTGAAIYLAVMEGLGFDELRLSTRGLRFGGLIDGV